MNVVDSIVVALGTAEMIAMAYLDDLTDADLMQRPVDGANHIKWQLGHLIASENKMINNCISGALPDLPSGFADRYASDKSQSDSMEAFDSKQFLLELYREQRQATLKTLETLTEVDLDVETQEPMRSYAPTTGAVFIMQSTHWMMHAGQWAVLRRKLGCQPLF